MFNVGDIIVKKVDQVGNFKIIGYHNSGNRVKLQSTKDLSISQLDTRLLKDWMVVQKYTKKFKRRQLCLK